MAGQSRGSAAELLHIDAWVSSLGATAGCALLLSAAARCWLPLLAAGCWLPLPAAGCRCPLLAAAARCPLLAARSLPAAAVGCPLPAAGCRGCPLPAAGCPLAAGCSCRLPAAAAGCAAGAAGCRLPAARCRCWQPHPFESNQALKPGPPETGPLWHATCGITLSARFIALRRWHGGYVPTSRYPLLAACDSCAAP
jgi:hypothetical protein